MTDILYHRRHRFDALFALLTGGENTGLPRNPRLRRDVGLSESVGRFEPSRITLAALVRRACR